MARQRGARGRAGGRDAARVQTWRDNAARGAAPAGGTPREFRHGATTRRAGPRRRAGRRASSDMARQRGARGRAGGRDAARVQTWRDNAARGAAPAGGTPREFRHGATTRRAGPRRSPSSFAGPAYWPSMMNIITMPYIAIDSTMPMNMNTFDWSAGFSLITARPAEPT